MDHKLEADYPYRPMDLGRHCAFTRDLIKEVQLVMNAGTLALCGIAPFMLAVFRLTAERDWHIAVGAQPLSSLCARFTR